jgi:hypothetical protein
MPLALASGWLRDGADSMARAAEAARGMGFTQVFASKPPRDAATGKASLDALGLSLAAVATDPVADLGGLRVSIDRAAQAAAALKRPLVVVDLGGVTAGFGETREVAVDRWARSLFDAMRAWSGLAIAVRPGADGGRLFLFPETEWLLDDLVGLPIGLWLDPSRALALQRSAGGPAPVAWADRFAARTLGVAIYGLGTGGGHARPEDDGPAWGTLRDLLPARAARVLDVGPAVPVADVIDARRRFEEELRW